MECLGKAHPRNRGFTIIEMVMVLIILAVVVVVVSSRPEADRTELAVQMEILKSHLRYAQLKAMNDEVPWGIHVPNSGSYVLYENNVQTSFLLPGERTQTHTLPATITVTAGVGKTYNFNHMGIPVDSGGTEIPTEQTITLSRGTASENITIVNNTGFIP